MANPSPPSAAECTDTSSALVLVPCEGLPIDHLPLPQRQDWTYTPPPWPYVCKEEYDGGSFLDYPARKGWTDEEVFEPIKFGRSPEEIASFFQAWFFFGLLTDVLRKPIQVSDFVGNDENGHPIITTKNLRELINRWYFKDAFLSVKSRDKHALRVYQSLSHIRRVLCTWNFCFTSPLSPWAVQYVNLLGTYISAACTHVYTIASRWNLMPLHHEARSWLPDLFADSHIWLDSTVFISQMLESGWCRSDVARLRGNLLPYGLLYASLLGPPNYTTGDRKQDHLGDISLLRSTSEPSVRIHPANRHDQCSDTKCMAYDCDERNYEPKHASQNCICINMAPDMERAKMMLERSQIPVVYVDEDATFQPASAQVPYVAISHVWSDGLGNPNANALPSCQLKRIASSVNELYDLSAQPVPFWMDTVCCPVDSLQARKTAIRLMAKTYYEADIVLVLDAYLESQSVRTLSSVDILMRLHCSKWNRRFWTLQERVLAQDRIRIRFADCTLSMMDIMFHPAANPSPYQGVPVLELGVSRLRHIRDRVHDLHSTITARCSGVQRAAHLDYFDLHGAKLSPMKRLLELQYLLSYRTTTKASDEAICVGTIMGLDIQSILAAQSGRRMEELWSAMPQIPSSVIFWIGPKLETKGFRWAPSTFINSMDQECRQLDEAHEAKIDPKGRGLIVIYPWWALGCRRGVKLRRSFKIIDPSDTMYDVVCLSQSCRKRDLDLGPLDPWTLETTYADNASLCIIAYKDLNQNFAEAKGSTYAILVVAYAFEKDIILARKVCPISIREHLDSESGKPWTIPPALKKIVQQTSQARRESGAWNLAPNDAAPDYALEYMGCSKLHGNRRWCID